MPFVPYADLTEAQKRAVRNRVKTEDGHQTRRILKPSDPPRMYARYAFWIKPDGRAAQFGMIALPTLEVRDGKNYVPKTDGPKKTGPSRGTSRKQPLAPDIVAAIRAAPRGQSSAIAARYNTSARMVRYIQNGERRARA
jgi:hypothetical protein